MKGVILAGGRGLRMSPLTLSIPKPLVPVLNVPVINAAIDFLKRQGIMEMAITVHNQADHIIETIGDGSKYGVQIQYLKESQPLGTCGGLPFLRDYLKDTFVVISADVVCDFDLDKALLFHARKNSPLTMITTSVPSPQSFGMVMTDAFGEVVHFIEKPYSHQLFTNLINTGIYIVEPRILEFIPEGVPFDFSKDLFPHLLQKKMKLFSYELTGYWMDVGQLPSYRRVHRDLLQSSRKPDLDRYKEVKMAVWVGENTYLSPLCTIEGPVIIGENCSIGDHSVITPYTIIGANTQIGLRCEINQSILWQNIRVGADACLSGAIVASNVVIGPRSSIFPNAIIADHVEVGADCLIGSHMHLYPNQTIAEGKIVHHEQTIQKDASFVPARKVERVSSDYFTHTIIPCHDKEKLSLLRSFIEGILTEGIETVFSEGIQIKESDNQVVTIYPYHHEHQVLLYTHADSKQVCLQLARKYRQKLLQYQNA